MQARIVQTLPELLHLQPHWDRLLAASHSRTPWQGFDFIRHWWEYVASPRQLRVVVVERDGSPCLIAPLQISREHWLGVIPIHILEPIGSLMDVNRPQFALGPLDEAAYRCALEAIWRIRSQWHLIRIDERMPGDAEVPLLRAFASQHQWMFREVFSHLCPYLDLRQDWEAYLAGRGSKMRKNLRAARRRLEDLGAITLQSHETVEEIAAGLKTVHELHARSWKRKRKIEHSQSGAYQRYYAGRLEAMARRGNARILVLSCGGQAVAATIAFTDGTTYYSAQIVHDRAFAACSPGTLLESMELEGLMRGGRHARYDMLGSFLSNKMRWTDSADSTTRLLIARPLLRTRLLDAYYFRLKPLIRPRLLPLLRRIRGKKID